MENPRRPTKNRGGRGDAGGGGSELHAAARSGDLAAVTSICAANPLAVNSRDGHSRTPLHLAAWSGQTEVASFLCKNKADAGAAAMDDMGSIHFASQKGHLEVVGVLLSSGASVKAVNRKGLTPLHYAVQGSHLELIKYLVRKGASLTAKTKAGQTPLDVANSEEVRSCLVESEQLRRKGNEATGSKNADKSVTMQTDEERKESDANDLSEDGVGKQKREAEEINEEESSGFKKRKESDANDLSDKAESEDEVGKQKREAEEINEEESSRFKKPKVSLEHLSAENDTEDGDQE